MAGIECRSSLPEEVDPAHHEEQRGDSGELPRVLLQARRQEEDEGEHEVEEDDDERKPLPATLHPRLVPGDLLRKIPGPDDQEL